LRVTHSGIGAVLAGDGQASNEEIMRALPGIRPTTPREAR